jgi:hypothetical protein
MSCTAKSRKNCGKLIYCKVIFLEVGGCRKGDFMSSTLSSHNYRLIWHKFTQYDKCNN